MINAGKKEGAKLATGGGRALDKGYFIQVGHALGPQKEEDNHYFYLTVAK